MRCFVRVKSKREQTHWYWLYGFPGITIRFIARNKQQIKPDFLLGIPTSFLFLLQKSVEYYLEDTFAMKRGIAHYLYDE